MTESEPAIINRDITNRIFGMDVISFAKACLSKCLGNLKLEAELSSHDLFQQPPLERVNATIRTHGRLRGSMSSKGQSLGAQIQEAVRRAACDTRFNSRLTAIELNHVDLEVWLQTGSERVSREEIAAANFLELGVDGVEVHLGSKSAYYKPSVAITKGKHTTQELLSALCRKAGLAKDMWKDPSAVILRTKWLFLSQFPTGTVSLCASRSDEITRADIICWLRESVAYLTNSLQVSGDFTYIYDPIRDLEAIESGNYVRLAGCLYSLSCFYDSPYADTAEIAFVNAIRTAAATQVERTIVRADGSRVIPELKPKALPKMGSTALLTLALGGKRLLQQFGPAYENLYQSVLLAQMPSGRFQTHLGSNVENMRSSEFFSGQALLTLVQRAEQDDTDARNRCSTAFAAYLQQFRDKPTTAFVGWHVDVWSRMALLTKRQDYVDFVFEQTDWLLKIQVKSAQETRWIGGFRTGDRMPKFSSIVFLEAVVKAYALALFVEDSERIGLYRRAILSGLRFCERLRLGNEQMAWFPNPQRSRGGIALSLLDRRVRCDVPQHFITLCLAILKAKDLIPDAITTLGDGDVSSSNERSVHSKSVEANKLMESSSREHLLLAIRDHAILRGKDQQLIGKNGSNNNWLIDTRRIIMQSSILDAIAETFWDMCVDLMPFQVCGMEVAAIPLLTAIVMKSKERGIPITGFIVRKERKNYGTGSLIEGTVTDSPIVVIDDILNSGGSLEKIRVVLESLRKSIEAAFVLIDFRSKKSKIWRAEHEIPIRAAFKLGEFDLALGRKDETPSSSSFHNVWSFASPDPNYYHRVPKSFPATDGKRVYFGSDSGYFWCLNADDGSVVWRFKVSSRGHKNIWSAPAIHNEKVYFGSYDGNVYCLDARSGTELWCYSGADWVGSSPALAPDLGLLFIGQDFSVEGKLGSIVSLNLESGEKVWEHMTKRYTHASPAYWPERQLVACGSNDNEMFLFDARTGTLHWRFETRGEGGEKGSIRHAPAFDVKRGHLVTGCADGNIYIIDIDTGKEVWSVRTNNTIYTVPLVVDDMAYVGSTDKYLYVLDLDRRKVKKKIYAGSKIYGPPRLLAGRIYFGACNGIVYEIDPVTTQVTGTHQLPDAITNALSYNTEDARFYALTYVNQLFAFVRE